jgi:hypothetical protein
MHEIGAAGTARPSVPGANTSLERTRPSTPLTSRTLVMIRRSWPPSAYSFRRSTKITKSMAPAISIMVASVGSRSLDWMA